MGTSATFSTPLSLALTPFGDLLVADAGPEADNALAALRYVRTGAGAALGSVATLPGPLRAFAVAQSRTTGVVYLGADCFVSASPPGLAAFALAAGGPTVPGRVCGAVDGPALAPDGVTRPQRLGVVGGLAYHEATAVLYLTDFTANAIRALDTASGALRTLAGALPLAAAVAPYPAPTFTAPGPPVGASLGAADGAGTAALLAGPWGLALDPTAPRLLFTDSYNNLVRAVALGSGAVTTLAGNLSRAAASPRTGGIATLTTGAVDGAGAGASFGEPLGLAVLPSGHALVCDPSLGLGAGLLRLVSPAGVVSTLLGLRAPPDGGGDEPADGGAANATLGEPAAVAVDAGRGIVWLLDGVGLVRNVSCAGLPAGAPGTPPGGAAAAAPPASDWSPVSTAVAAALGCLALAALAALAAAYLRWGRGGAGAAAAAAKAPQQQQQGAARAQQELPALSGSAVVVMPPRGVELWAKGAGGSP